MEAFWLAFGVVFVAELGDKSQLMALAFATRYKTRHVLLGVTAAAAVMFAIAVAAGDLAAAALPDTAIRVIAGLAFIAFGVWTMWGRNRRNEDVTTADQRSPILTVAAAFFIAELGDKTMLATMTLASTTQGAIGTWAGATLGMVIADALAIVVGRQLGARLLARTLRIGAAVVFVVIGLALVADAIR